MSRPRFIIPGAAYLVTRRCFQRQFLLRPSPQVNQIFKYCLAHASERYKIRIHAFCVLSNHYHIVLTDTDGRLPEFMHWLNEYVAKCINTQLKRWESFWAPGSYNAVRLLDRVDIIAAMVYTYVNPVQAGLVGTVRSWPGACCFPEDIDSSSVIDRPKGFFRNNGPTPDRATLRIDLPDALDQTDVDELLPREIVRREHEIRAEARQTNRRFLGRGRVLKQSPFKHPRCEAQRGTLKPLIACRDKFKRIEALRQLKIFLDAYHCARQQFVAGVWNAFFPFGTYGMRIWFGVKCAEP
jgi:REP element-mobilizing transposase RayT